MLGVLVGKCNSKEECDALLEANPGMLVEVYKACSKGNRLADGIYVAQLLTWFEAWAPAMHKRQFMILATSDMIEQHNRTVQSVANHVAVRTGSANSSLEGRIPVENQTRKKKDYLVVNMVFLILLQS
jgi:hypothetical protein